MSQGLEEFSDGNFDEKVLKSAVPVLVDFLPPTPERVTPASSDSVGKNAARCSATAARDCSTAAAAAATFWLFTATCAASWLSTGSSNSVHQGPRASVSAGAEWRGFHIFAGSQALAADAISETQRQTLALAARLAGEAGVDCPHLNLGGGFGIPYFPGDAPVDIARIGGALGEELANLPSELANTRFCIELGRWLVGEAGIYLTRIVERKVSHGEIFLITDGGLHHQLAAAGQFGTVVRRNYPVAIATRFGAPQQEVASVVGCLCTPLDRLTEKGSFPEAYAGDLVAIFCAGAYGASASPAAFLGQGPAREILV